MQVCWTEMLDEDAEKYIDRHGPLLCI